MIVVIVIMAMVAGLVLVRQPWHSAGLNTDATVRALTNGIAPGPFPRDRPGS